MKNKYIVLIKVALHALSLVPLARLLLGWYRNSLGANPIEFITRSTGTWTLVFLLVSLSVTPLRKLPKMHWLIRVRRMLGLYAFFYACLHFTTYLWLDRYFEWQAVAQEAGRSFVSLIVEDIAKRPFITVGFAGFALLVPLALVNLLLAGVGLSIMQVFSWQFNFSNPLGLVASVVMFLFFNAIVFGAFLVLYRPPKVERRSVVLVPRSRPATSTTGR